MSEPRSYLFVPGQRPDRFAKASNSGADAVILDLEDAVGPDAKAEARARVVDWFGQGGQGIVRINGQGTPWHDDDLAALASLSSSAIMVPKAEPNALSHVAERLPGRSLIALVETVAGLDSLRTLAKVPGVVRLAFGNLDFAADARIPESGEELDPARFEMVIASRLAGLAKPVDGVTTGFSDDEATGTDVLRARKMGFGAKLCVHPAQVEAVNAGFSPTSREIEWASRVVAAVEGAAGSVVQVDGKMVDRPLIDQARQILAGADRMAS